MSQITATLTIPSDEIALMQALSQKLERMHAATLGMDILTTEEACTELKCSENTLKKWRDEGWLPYFSEGKIIKYKRKAIVEAYELHFGQQTHFGVIREIQLNSKKRAS